MMKLLMTWTVECAYIAGIRKLIPHNNEVDALRISVIPLMSSYFVANGRCACFWEPILVHLLDTVTLLYLILACCEFLKIPVFVCEMPDSLRASVVSQMAVWQQTETKYVQVLFYRRYSVKLSAWFE